MLSQPNGVSGGEAGANEEASLRATAVTVVKPS